MSTIRSVKELQPGQMIEVHPIGTTEVLGETVFEIRRLLGWAVTCRGLVLRDSNKDADTVVVLDGQVVDNPQLEPGALEYIRKQTEPPFLNDD